MEPIRISWYGCSSEGELWVRMPRAAVMDRLEDALDNPRAAAASRLAGRQAFLGEARRTTFVVQREHFLFDKDKLMAIPGADGSFLTANPRHEPGDPTHPGIDRDRH